MTGIFSLFCLGFLILIHELGHFLAARWAGVKVLAFAIGFGKVLFRWTRNETEYQVRILPLGGFVQMLDLGEDGEPQRPEWRGLSYPEASVKKRAAIMLAGPMMNLVLPFVFLPVMFMVGVPTPAYLAQPACVAKVVDGGLADKAGMRAGDCILSLNDKEVPTWRDLGADLDLMRGDGGLVVFGVARPGAADRLRLSVLPPNPTENMSLGALPLLPAVIEEVYPDTPAAAAGLLPGDRIEHLGGVTVSSWYDIDEPIQNSEGKPLTIGIARTAANGDLSAFSFEITPGKREGGYFLGINPKQETITVAMGPVDAVAAGARKTVEMTAIIGKFFSDLFSGDEVSGKVAGPITILKAVSSAAQTNFANLLGFLAFLSLQLGFLNLLPIPVLDGGNLVFLGYEATVGKRPSPRVQAQITRVGASIVLGIFAIAIFNDLVGLFK